MFQATRKNCIIRELFLNEESICLKWVVLKYQVLEFLSNLLSTHFVLSWNRRYQEEQEKKIYSLETHLITFQEKNDELKTN